MKNLARFASLVGCICATEFCTGGNSAVDLVVTNGVIYTAELDNPTASALAVKDGRILFVGSNEGAMELAGPGTEVLDLEHRTVIPGMIDAHAHLTWLGFAMTRLNLVGTRSYEEVVSLVAEHAGTAAPGEWIRGRGWDQNDWENTAFPTHERLSSVTPQNPVFLTRIDGHATFVNARAMELVDLDRMTIDPEAGRIIRDADGNPTGVLIDAAADSVEARIAQPTRRQVREATAAAIAHFNSLGVTGVHDAGVGADTIDAHEELAAEGNFNLRSYVMISNNDAVIDHYLDRGPQSGLYGGRIWIRAIKIQADGAMGSRGAALIDDYTDEPGNRGLITGNYDRIYEVALRALRSGFQLSVHAIGDRANRMVLDAFQAAFAVVPKENHRFRIEHAQTIHPDDIPRFAALGVIPSMQGSHQTSDMYWIEERLGPERVNGAYAWRSLRDTGVIIPNGSDTPVEFPNPLISFRAFFTRMDAEGYPEGGWHPEQRMTRQEALLSVTLWPAQASFMEEDVGSLARGKYADFVVLDRDIMTVAESEILDSQVIMTFLGGERVFSREN